MGAEFRMAGKRSLGISFRKVSIQNKKEHLLSYWMIPLLWSPEFSLIFHHRKIALVYFTWGAWNQRKKILSCHWGIPVQTAYGGLSEKSRFVGMTPERRCFNCFWAKGRKTPQHHQAPMEITNAQLELTRPGKLPHCLMTSPDALTFIAGHKEAVNQEGVVKSPGNCWNKLRRAKLSAAAF